MCSAMLFAKMARSSLLILLALLPLALCGSLSLPFRKHKTHYEPRASADPGKPLFLTPYIQKGEIQQARAMSKVEGIAGLTSYAGFFTVNESDYSNMYFWFFPAQNGKKDAPLLLWLQGGPGGSSLFGLFNENGPILVDKDGQVHRRNVTWNTNYHMVYIDNPVGTGFSFTNTTAGFATNETQVAINLYSALTQFFTVFSDYQTSDFYVTGESYAGKYVPAIGYKIYLENQKKPAVKINFKGVAIGDGLIDPEHMLTGYGELLFQFGMADENQASHINNMTDKAAELIRKGMFFEAFEIFDELLNGDLYPYPTYFFNITGVHDYYNILRIESPPEFNYYVPYLNTVDVRKAIHVGNLSYGSQSTQVEKSLMNDIMDSTADIFAVLLENYKVLLYNGQLDIIVGAPLTERFLQDLQWSGRQQYLQAERRVWRIGSDVAGYVRTVQRFMQVVVRGGGHILPYDQPERTLNMLDTFINMQ